MCFLLCFSFVCLALLFFSSLNHIIFIFINLLLGAHSDFSLYTIIPTIVIIISYFGVYSVGSVKQLKKSYYNRIRCRCNRLTDPCYIYAMCIEKKFDLQKFRRKVFNYMCIHWNFLIKLCNILYIQHVISLLYSILIYMNRKRISNKFVNKRHSIAFIKKYINK